MIFRNILIRLLLPLYLFLIFSGCQILKNLDILSLDRRGVYHTVQEGQTLYFIARTYDIDVNRLRQINGIYDPTKLQVGTRLWIPGATQVLRVNLKKSEQVAIKERKRAKKSSTKRGSDKTVKVVKGFLIWPVKGQLTSKFGNRNGLHHDGIDIGARNGAPIVSAADGKVMFSGWGPTGYGLMLIIKHNNNLTTVYAHNSHIHVQKNQVVKKGQKIASVGSTGRSTGPHIHFEVRYDTNTQNPLTYLPKRSVTQLFV